MINSNIPNLDSMSMVRAKVDFYNGSTLVQTCTCGDYLEDFELTREGDNSKFFGFGICHKLDINLIDLHRTLKVTKENTVEIGLGDGTTWDAPYPTFYITELKRNEKTNSITGTAYDKVYWASEYLFEDLGLEAPYTIRQVAQAVATKLGLTLNIPTAISNDFALSYAEGANLEKTEDLRSILNWIAEATQTVYYVNYQNQLTFKRLDRTGAAVKEITRDLYYELDTKTPRTLVTICNATELGDNLEVALEGETGAIQYIRNNPFLELRTDLAELLEKAKTNIAGITITQVNCDWSGDYRLEIGDKIAFITEDGGRVYSYLLSDAITFAGTLNEKTEWDYTDQQPETYANPTNIGERINQTFAKVDKIEKKITLYVSEVVDEILPTKIDEALENFEDTVVAEIADALEPLGKDVTDLKATTTKNTENIATLVLDTKSITNEVSALKETTTTLTDNLGEVVATQTEIQEDIGNLEVTAQNISASVTSVNNRIDEVVNAAKTELSNDIIEVEERLSGELEVTAKDITASVEAINTRVSEVEGTIVATEENLKGQLQVTAEAIGASVSSVEKKVTDLDEQLSNGLDQVDNRIDTVAKDVSLKLDKQGVEIAIESTLSEGVEKVVTASKKYTFDDTGLNVSSSDSEISTKVTENGMRIYRYNKEVLTVNNEGVRAADLHATTFLLIGENSRLEDRGNRTACFWIGQAGG